MINDLLSMFFSIPWWIWLILGVAWLLHRSDRSIWEYEVKFYEEGIGRGEVEIELTKKKGMYVECDFELDEKYGNRPIDIILNGEALIQVPSEENISGQVDYVRNIYIPEPNVADEVSVKIDDKEIFSGKLKPD